MANVIPTIIKDGIVQSLNPASDVAQVGGLDSAGSVDINRQWVIGRNLADSADLNILHLNADDQAEFGIDLALEEWQWPDDSGAVVAMDMSVTATPAAGVEESYTHSIDGVGIIQVYAEADGAGAIQSEAFFPLKGQGFKSVPVNDANYTILDDDFSAIWTAITAPRVCNISATAIACGSSTKRRWFHVGDDSGGCGAVNTITITPLGGATINGAPNLVLNTAYASVLIQSDGTNLRTM